MCAYTVLQADVQVLEEPHVSKSGQELGMLRVMSLDGVAQHPSPASTPRGEHCTHTASNVEHKPQIMAFEH